MVGLNNISYKFVATWEGVSSLPFGKIARYRLIKKPPSTRKAVNIVISYSINHKKKAPGFGNLIYNSVKCCRWYISTQTTFNIRIVAYCQGHYSGILYTHKKIPFLRIHLWYGEFIGQRWS